METYHHVIEVYRLHVDPARAATPLGEILQRYEHPAEGAEQALRHAQATAAGAPPHENYFVAVFQGFFDSGHKWPVGWWGNYTMEQWEGIRFSLPHDGMKGLIARHCVGARAAFLPPRTPELDKLREAQGHSLALSAFVDWLEANGMRICETTQDEGYRDSGYWPIMASREELFARHFSIDLRAVETERRAVLEKMRRLVEVRAGKSDEGVEEDA